MINNWFVRCDFNKQPDRISPLKITLSFIMAHELLIYCVEQSTKKISLTQRDEVIEVKCA